MTRFEELEPQYMFEALGYEKYENHPSDKPETGFTTQDCPYLQYTNTLFTKSIEDKKVIIAEVITFGLQEKVIRLHGYRSDVGNLPAPINMSELIAIVRQAEELGWIEGVGDIKEK